MSYQDLRRTPTSAGNQKVFTYSCWIKRNGLSAWARLLSIMDGNTDAIIQLTNVDKLRFRDEVTGPDIDYISSRPLRDAGGWMHVLVAIDTTATQAEHRIRMYINGDSLIEHGLDTESMPGDKNLDLQFNDSGLEHRFFARNNDSEYFLGEAFDLFWVDGQALTPDVFGFNKDGDGYVSVGSTQATDFRPGQWVPKSPRTIKSEINRRGGFGVNGFYLPMNDSSNFGADFHCAPDSIIKLKGEDLPQPRNGAPTTSDAYVSQLRQEAGSLGFDGVVAFDGAGDYLTIADNSDFAFGTGDFTVEAFVFATELGNYNTIFDTSSTGQDTTGIRLGVQSNGQLYLYTNGFFLTANDAISTGRWYHIAYVRNSGTHRLFVNGVQLDSTSTARDYTNDSCVIGSHFAFGESWEGFISNLRVVKGTALYTSNFTAPTEALTNVTNTKLLCCNSSTSATAATVSPGSITANGNASATRNELTGSIVLAVPGIDTNTNPELVTNGDFSNGTTGWTGLSGGSLSVEDGKLKITETTGVVDAYAVNGTAITTEVGKTYTIKWTFTEGTNTSFTIRFGNSGNQSLEYQSNGGGSGTFNHSGSYAYTFTATATQLNLSFIVNQASSYGYLSNVSVKEAVPIRDYSADIRGSGTNRTPTLYKCGVTSPVPSYYGSAIATGGGSDYLYYDLDGSGANAYGTGDFTFECWFFAIEEPSAWGILMQHATNGSWNNGITLCSKHNTNRKFNIYTQDGSSNVQTIGSTVWALNQWHHVVAERYNGQLTLYVNGVADATIADTRNYAVAGTPASSAQYALSIGAQSDGSYQSNGYFQDVRVYKGVAKYKGGFDVSKPYTPVGFEGGSWRQVSDTCKNNFATLNPSILSNPGLTDGNLKIVGAGGWIGWFSTFSFVSGKYYMEMHFPDTTNTNSYYHGFGLKHDGFASNASGEYFGDATGKAAALVKPGSITLYNNGNQGDIATGTYTGSHIMGMAIDADSGKVWWSMDGTWIGANPSTGSSASYTFTAGQTVIPGVTSYQSSVSGDLLTANFGQNPTFSGTVTAGTYTDGNGKGLFKYQPPTGFLALCEDNLPTPAIADPGEHFKCVLYTGDNASSHAISGVGFQPDLVWLKRRNGTTSHNLTDSVRGIGYTLFSDDTSADNTEGNRLRSFGSNGFTVGANGAVNQSGSPFVAWCWKAGGAAVANTSGSINSQVSVNQTAGFSIVSFTSTSSGNFTIGHGLGKTPKLIITKERGASNNWHVWHSGVMTTSSQFLMLNSTAALGSYSNVWGTSIPTSLVFGANVGSLVNASTASIAYCWAEIEGYSKFGSYTGNGSTDGPFVYCGFKPAFVMTKRTDTTGEWWMYDSSRGSTNPNARMLLANSSGTENEDSASYLVDFLSNGFKIRAGLAALNGNGGSFIFMAFAESPFQTANAK